MAITVFSRIQREHLREMYLSYCYSRSGNQSDAACSDKVLGLVALYARAAIIDLVAETRTEDFFRERVRIVEAMTRVVREAVAPLTITLTRTRTQTRTRTRTRTLTLILTLTLTRCSIASA